MSAVQRREQIIQLMRKSSSPLSGGALGQATGVSRQIVVQDIALLRSEGYDIISTARGYMLNESKQYTRLFKTYHSDERTEEELNIIVDLGGTVVDVMVNHRVYSRVTASMNIKTRRDVQNFIDALSSSKSTPLKNITSGYHFHHIAAEQEEILDEIEEALRKNGFLAELLPYEREYL